MRDDDLFVGFSLPRKYNDLYRVGDLVTVEGRDMLGAPTIADSA